MTDNLRDQMQDQLPDLAAGSLDPARAKQLRTALENDPELRREFDLISTLREGRPNAPAGLADRIRAGIAEPTRERRWIGWPLSTAALLVIALGTAVLWGEEEEDPGSPLPVEDPVSSVFPTDDGLVAGELILADLSDDELEALLEEIGG